MGKNKPFDEDDMSNYAFERFDEDVKTDEDLLNDWNTEGPEDKEVPEVTEQDGAVEPQEEPNDDD